MSMPASRPRLLSRLAEAAAALGLGALLTIAGIGLVLGTSGVFDRRAGAWTLPVAVLPGVRVDANVAGLARLATSPIGLRLLDGRAQTTRIGHLRLSREGDTLVVLCAPCRLHDSRIAAKTVALPAIALRATRRAGVESNNLIDLVLSAPEVTVQAVATLSPTGIALDWQLADTPIAALYALAADAVPEAKLARIEGRARAEGRLQLPSLKAGTRLSIEGFEVGGLTTERLQSGWFTYDCRAADGRLRTRLAGEGERGWLDTDALGALLPAAVLAAEDQRFHQHAGYDAVEIAQVLGAMRAGPDEEDDSSLRGASTLTQQLARTLFTGPERTLARKLRELLYAVEMERTLGKARILQLYLNTVHWGPGLCGARAAARAYFGKRVAQLSPLEAAWLAAALRAPHAAHAQQLAGAPDLERARRVLMQMRELPRAERQRAARQPLVLARPARSGEGAALAAAR